MGRAESGSSAYGGVGATRQTQRYAQHLTHNAGKGAADAASMSQQLWALHALGPRLAAHARTQAGSKALQSALTGGDPAVVTLVFEQSVHEAHLLIGDNFGNYFIQALFRACIAHSDGPEMRLRLLEVLRPAIVDIACDRNGTYALQSIVDSVGVDAHEHIMSLRAGLAANPLRLAMHPGGTHVLQRFARRFAPQYCDFVVDMVRVNVATIAIHPNAVAFVLLLLDGGDPRACAAIVSLAVAEAPFLAAHPHGNYVLQHLLSRGNRDLMLRDFPGATEALSKALVSGTPVHAAGTLTQALDVATAHVSVPTQTVDVMSFTAATVANDRDTATAEDTLAGLTLAAALARRLRGMYVFLAMHKYGSNVVEKCVVWGGPFDRAAIIRELFADRNLVRSLLCDSFANYVVQTLLQTAPMSGDAAAAAERAFLVDALAPNLSVFEDGRTHPSVHAKWVTIMNRLERCETPDDDAGDSRGDHGHYERDRALLAAVADGNGRISNRSASHRSGPSGYSSDRHVRSVQQQVSTISGLYGAGIGDGSAVLPLHYGAGVPSTSSIPPGIGASSSYRVGDARGNSRDDLWHQQAYRSSNTKEHQPHQHVRSQQQFLLERGGGDAISPFTYPRGSVSAVQSESSRTAAHANKQSSTLHGKNNASEFTSSSTAGESNHVLPQNQRHHVISSQNEGGRASIDDAASLPPLFHDIVTHGVSQQATQYLGGGVEPINDYNSMNLFARTDNVFTVSRGNMHNVQQPHYFSP